VSKSRSRQLESDEDKEKEKEKSTNDCVKWCGIDVAETVACCWLFN
jgi:hypothetical protein